MRAPASGAHNLLAATPEVAFKLKGRTRSHWAPAALLFWLSRDDTMSSLHMFLPASEPARSEALAQLQKTHHIPRHLTRGIARRGLGERGSVVQTDPSQIQQQASLQDLQTPAAPE